MKKIYAVIGTRSLFGVYRSGAAAKRLVTELNAVCDNCDPRIEILDIDANYPAPSWDTPHHDVLVSRAIERARYGWFGAIH